MISNFAQFFKFTRQLVYLSAVLLLISAKPAIAVVPPGITPTWTVTPSAGAGGTITPSTPVTVNNGATTTFTVTPNSGYTAAVGGTCGGSLNWTTYTTNAITANCTVSATFTTGPINGVCGSANGGTFTTAPTTNLCSAGTPTAVSGSGPWTWSCTGSNGGSTASCSANVSGGGGGGQITNIIGGFSLSPSINAGGTRIAFVSTLDLVPGGNSDGNAEVFLWTQGAGITQITHTALGDYPWPSINADGTRITFISNRDLTGGNSDGNAEVFLWTQGAGITQITYTTGCYTASRSINADGTRIAFESYCDLTGGNPDGNAEIFLWTQGSGITRITNTIGGSNWATSINADGTRIAFESDRNLTGDNPDSNMKIFLATLAIGPRVDLTVRGSGSGPDLTNPITVTYSVQGCSGKEMFLILNAPAMGLPWSYLGIAGWVPLPANLAEITPYASGPADGTYTQFSGTVPAGSYELYLGCDFVNDGHLNIDAGGMNGVYDGFSVTVQ